MPKVIKSESDYERALTRVEQLIDLNPQAGSEASEELHLLSMLVEAYESVRFPSEIVDSVTAVEFRMEQLDLAPRDLAPWFGTKSRVSEFLAGKRPLSTSVAIRLHQELKIPFDVLLKPRTDEPSEAQLDWDRIPFKEIAKRGWIPLRERARAAKANPAEIQLLVKQYLPSLLQPAFAHAVLHRKTANRIGSAADPYALATWAAYIVERSREVKLDHEYSHAEWTSDTLCQLRALSQHEHGVRNAVSFLEERGIIVDLVPHLPKTKLDGAALLRADGTPIIALTVRHDRQDNFWFTLMHELGHVIQHLSGVSAAEHSDDVFLDDLEVVTVSDRREKEADDFAREALIPHELWERSAVKYLPNVETAKLLAKQANVSVAVVAGRVRRERNNFRLLAGLVETGTVRKHFPEISWA